MTDIEHPYPTARRNPPLPAGVNSSNVECVGPGSSIPSRSMSHRLIAGVMLALSPAPQAHPGLHRENVLHRYLQLELEELRK
jgi:hypothetical protein